MSRNILICSIIILFFLNIFGYIFTFPKSFATQNKEFYDIISIFNDFIFISCFFAGLKSLQKSKLNSCVVFLSIPLIYTLLLCFYFR